MNDYIVKDTSLANFSRSPKADGGFSWERTDLIDTLKVAA